MLLLFFLVWIVFNGRITLEITLFGIAVSALMLLFICRFMGYSLAAERRFYRLALPFFRYVLLLLKEIVVANVAVCRMILTRKEVMEPVLVRIHTDLETETARVILANSITLTPGTITVSLTGQELLVHCLDESLAVGLEDSEFARMLREMEKEAV